MSMALNAMPKHGEGVCEEARIHTAALGVYEYGVRPVLQLNWLKNCNG